MASLIGFVAELAAWNSYRKQRFFVSIASSLLVMIICILGFVWFRNAEF
jgi:hypothetical protein